MILVDGCKLSEKDSLDFTFIWVHDRPDRRGGMNMRQVQEELALRIQNGGLTTVWSPVLGHKKHKLVFLILEWT